MKKFSLDAKQWEVVFRMSLTLLCGYSLSIAYLPNVIPPAFANIVGIAAGILIFVLPKLVFTIGVAVPLLFGVFTLIFAAASALLAAATVSDGLMTAVFAIYALFITLGFHSGKGADKLWSLSAPTVTFAGMAGTSFSPIVQNGLSASQTLDGDPTETSGLTRLILTALCWAQQGVSLERCNIANITAQATGQLPDDLGNALAGQTIVVTLNNDTLSANIPGGLWLVSAFWTEHGLTNPLAVWRNVYIVLCWAAIAIMASIFIPFPRTIRTSLTKLAVPGALSMLAKMLTGDESTAAEIQDKIGPLWSVMSGGDKAKLLAFEPRLCRAPFENIEPKVHALMLEVDHAILASILTLDAKKRDEVNLSEDPQKYFEKNAGLLTASAKALSSGEAVDAEELETLRKVTTESDTFVHGSGLIQRQCEHIADATIGWLHALDCKNKTKLSTKEKLSNLLTNYKLWLMVAAAPSLKTLATFAIPFKPELWSLRKFLWSAKRAGGFVALFCMIVYWPSYANFRFQTSTESIGGVFSGWELFGYAFAWQLTTEGTIKKSIQRMIGTCVGGFLAWLGAIVCAGSYDDFAPINPYGYIAWLTVTATIVAMFSLDKGFKAFMGANYDHGTSTLYTVMVETIIALDIFVHKGSKNDLTANRIVATLVGITMAVFIAMIPPYVRGGDPSHSRDYVASIKDAMTSFQKDVADESIDVEVKNLDDVYLKEVAHCRKFAMLLLKDAGKLGFIKVKFLHPDDRLKPLQQQILMTESLFGELVEYIKFVKENFEEDWDGVCSAAKQFSEKGLDSFSAVEVMTGPDVHRANFISSARTLHDRLKEHEEALDEICGFHRREGAPVEDQSSKLESDVESASA